MADFLPEAAQTREAVLRRIAGNDRRIDRADRDTGHPIGQIFGGSQRLVYASLVAAECATTLQNESNLLVIRIRPRRWLAISQLHISECVRLQDL